MTRWTPYVTVATVIERAGRFLLVEEDRGGPHTLFNQPAGHLEPGERIGDGALREVVEETAWRVDITHYLGMYVYHAPSGKTFHSHAFCATALAPLDNPIDRDILATHWLSLEEVEALDRKGRLRSPLVLRRIHDSLAGRFHPLEVLHEQ